MRHARRLLAITAAAAALAALAVGPVLAAPPADRGGMPNPGMERMHELHHQGNPGMERMHEVHMEVRPHGHRNMMG